ncbi:MAG: histidine phosphatase family protein [Bdellovibrionaceae bacterium]|nr:histidine phosphatase family protein [Bdellovibrio sp.]
MKIRNIYVVRHGETDWNKAGRFQGRTDIKLNEAGREQALALRPVLQQLQIESVYSSTLSRAFESAELATQDLKLSIQKEDHLRETNIGEAEGLTVEEITEKFGDDSILKWRSYEERLLDFRFPNGESKRELMYRLRQMFLDIAQNSNRTSIAVFSHGMLMRAMTFVFGAGIPWEQHLFTNGSIHHYIWTDEDPERLIHKGKI